MITVKIHVPYCNKDERRVRHFACAYVVELLVSRDASPLLPATSSKPKFTSARDYENGLGLFHHHDTV